MTTYFLSQQEAADYARSIDDRAERVLVEAALSHVIGFLIRDERYLARCATNPIDLLTYVRAVHALAKNRRLLDEALSGKYEHLDDIPDLF